MSQILTFPRLFSSLYCLYIFWSPHTASYISQYHKMNKNNNGLLASIALTVLPKQLYTTCKWFMLTTFLFSPSLSCMLDAVLYTFSIIVSTCCILLVIHSLSSFIYLLIVFSDLNWLLIFYQFPVINVLKLHL